MQLRYDYRLDLWPRHPIVLQKAFGRARAVLNDGRRAREAAREAGEPYVTDSELSARLTAVKGTPGRAWLGEVSSAVLRQALADLNMAYRNFFASIKGNRRGPKAEEPRFGLAVTVGRAQLGPEPVPARRGEAGTHAKSRREVA